MAIAFIYNRRPGAAVGLHVHSYTAEVTAPTCTEQGYTTYTCKCGESYVSDYVDALGHNYSGAWESDENGHWQLCSRCGDKSEVIAHTPGAEATEESAQTCTVCGYVIAPALDHTHSYSDEWESDESGHWKVCSKCGESSKVEAHTPGAEATEESAQLCTVCGYVITPALAHTHNFTYEVIGPTCTSAGYTIKKCSCGSVSKINHYSPLGHDKNSTVTKAPTCTEEGNRYWWCSRCDWTENEVIPVVAHTEETVNAIPASCNTVGYTEGCKCSVCQSFITVPIEVPALGHDISEEWEYNDEEHFHRCSRCGFVLLSEAHTDTAIGSIATPAQCLSNEEHYKKCPTCGYEFKDRFVEIPYTATGHVTTVMTYKPYNDTQHKVYRQCTACNEITTAIKYQDHEWGTYMDENFKLVKRCAYCGYEMPV